ncbi:rubredoxin [Synechococcus sp. CC9902]|uniref:rubredoxin n=1 Tax=Synechococcus sp. (strain CC9902) TaxID=316279 RepID=UPI0002E9CA22
MSDELESVEQSEPAAEAAETLEKAAVSDELESVKQSEPAPETAVEASAETDPRTHRFECRSCGYVYDPEEGVKKVGIDAGTAFSDLDPLSFRCPVCRSKVAAFRDIGPRTKASGFEENLNYGLGVNRMTPGQKNVLIFGSLALGFAFFLSLYSLR